MEQFTRECGIDGEDLANASCAMDMARDTNGLIETTSIASYEKNGGSYALRAIVALTKENSAHMVHGIKDYSDDSRGWIHQAYLKPLGIEELETAKKFRADIAEANSTHQNEVQNSARNLARCSAIRGLVYLLENKLITL